MRVATSSSTRRLGSTAAWPLAARAQQPNRVRRVGILVGQSENDPYYRSIVATFIEELARLGWVEGRDLQIHQRWGNDDRERTQALAKELLALQSEVILTVGTASGTATLQRESRTIPVVFTIISDPVGLGFVASLPRPGGNLTGFISIQGTIAGIWLQFIKEIAPHIKRAAAMYNPDFAPYAGYFLGPFEAAAQMLMVEPIIAEVRSVAEIESTIGLLGRQQAGLVILPEVFTAVHSATIAAAATRNKVPAITSSLRSFTENGGLMRYGPNNSVLSRIFPRVCDETQSRLHPNGAPVTTTQGVKLGQMRAFTHLGVRRLRQPSKPR
jgi:putative ABC transport system substrate-binding protein